MWDDSISRMLVRLMIESWVAAIDHIGIEAAEHRQSVRLQAPSHHQLPTAAHAGFDLAMDVIVTDAADRETDVMLWLHLRRRSQRFRPYIAGRKRQARRN